MPKWEEHKYLDFACPIPGWVNCILQARISCHLYASGELFCFCLVIGGLFLSQMMKPVMGGDAELWERRLAAKVGPFVCLWNLCWKIQWLNAFQNGVYDLKSVSDDYETFLTAIGIPSFAVFFILRGSENLEMEILGDGSVKSKTITGDVNWILLLTSSGLRSRCSCKLYWLLVQVKRVWH